MVGNTAEATTGSTTRKARELREGTVVSDKGDKTLKVRFDYQVKHPKYGKHYRRSTTLHTHDESNEGKVGDVVEVMACRRISKTKFWRLKRIIRSV